MWLKDFGKSVKIILYSKAAKECIGLSMDEIMILNGHPVLLHAISIQVNISFCWIIVCIRLLYRTYFFSRDAFVRSFSVMKKKREMLNATAIFFRFSKLIGPSSIAFQALKRVVKMLIPSGAET